MKMIKVIPVNGQFGIKQMFAVIIIMLWGYQLYDCIFKK